VVGTVVACSSLFSWVIARERVPQMLADQLMAFSDQAWVFLTVTNILLLLLGCFMDAIPILLLVAPVLLPAAAQFGIDPVHFGVALFTVAKVGDIALRNLIKETMPMLVPLMLVLVVLTYVPPSFMWLPRWVYGK